MMLLVIFLIFFQGPNFVRVNQGGDYLQFQSQSPSTLNWGVLCGKGKIICDFLTFAVKEYKFD